MPELSGDFQDAWVGEWIALKKAITQWSKGRSARGKKAKATPKSEERPMMGTPMTGLEGRIVTKAI